MGRADLAAAEGARGSVEPRGRSRKDLERNRHLLKRNRQPRRKARAETSHHQTGIKDGSNTEVLEASDGDVVVTSLLTPNLPLQACDRLEAAFGGGGAV